jgi:hypothetical protein
MFNLENCHLGHKNIGSWIQIRYTDFLELIRCLGTDTDDQRSVSRTPRGSVSKPAAKSATTAAKSASAAKSATTIATLAPAGTQTETPVVVLSSPEGSDKKKR